MTKKHFIALADAIKLYEKHQEPHFTIQQMDMLADFCAAQNPRFNRERWLDYIGR